MTPIRRCEGLIDKIYLIFYPRHTTLCHNANVSSFMTATHVTNQHIVTSPQTFSLSLHLQIFHDAVPLYSDQIEAQNIVISHLTFEISQKEIKFKIACCKHLLFATKTINQPVSNGFTIQLLYFMFLHSTEEHWAQCVHIKRNMSIYICTSIYVHCQICCYKCQNMICRCHQLIPQFSP